MYPPNSPSPERTSVVLAVPRGMSEAALIAQLGRSPDDLAVVATANDAASLEQAVRQTRHQIILLHHHLPNAWQGLGRFLSTISGAPVIMLSERELFSEPDLLNPDNRPFHPAIYAEAERSGCVGVAAWPPTPGSLGPLARGVLLERRTAAPAREHQAMVIGLYSDSHSGASELAINVAALVGMRGTREQRVLLADLDPASPDLHLLLRLSLSETAGLDHLWSLYGDDLKEGGGTLLTSEKPLAPFVTRYPSLNRITSTNARSIDILTGLQNRQLVVPFGTAPSAAGPLVRLMRGNYDVVVLDLGRDLGRMGQALAAECDHLFVVTSPLPADLETDGLGYTRLIKATGLARSRTHLVLNRWGDPTVQHTIEEAVLRFDNIDLAGAVDLDDPLVRRARWEGFPPPALDPGPSGLTRPFVAQVEAVVEHIMPGALAPRQPSTLGRLVSRGRGFVDQFQRRSGLGTTSTASPNSTAGQTPDRI